VGAYGLALEGLDAPDMLVPVGAEAWPTVRIGQAHGGPDGAETIDADRARIDLGGGMCAFVEREGARATLEAPSPVTDDVLVHPFLAAVGTAFACWTGGEAFHGGAFAGGGGAWALMGDRGAGKSSTLAALAGAGHPVVTDDLLVVREGQVMAGPRCVDLRPSAVSSLQLGVAGVSVRAGGRRRLALQSAAPELPLQGWVFLAWGDRVTVRKLPPAERFRRLMSLRSVFPPEPEGVLDLVRWPAWELERPRDWSSMPATIERLVSLAAA
jgi:hypothetical protein